MKRVLLVDDDPLVLRLYKDGLSRQGVKVDTASDGVAAIQALRSGKPDLVVLDLMMPKFTGVDVLKFIRAHADLAGLPVVVLSNSYMNELARQAVSLGVEKALLKAGCSLSVLIGIINDICAGKPTSEDPAHLLAVPKEERAAVPATVAPPPVPAAPPPAPAHPNTATTSAPTQPECKTAAAQFQAKARRSLFDNAPADLAALRGLCQAFANASNPIERSMSLQNFYRKVHFIAATAGLAECHPLAQIAGAFEALLFELMDKPAFVTPSVLRTLAATVEFIGLLFDCARDPSLRAPPTAHVLVVDDDPLSNRLVVAALHRAHLQAKSAEDPAAALQLAQERHYDLVLSDIEMPGMDGFEFCRRLRLLPGYGKTPVIYVTVHNDFEHRARSILSGGGDLIAKPVFPIELAVKALTHLLKKQLGI